MIKANLTINTGKTQNEQPDVVGRTIIDGKKYSIALWAQVTKAGDNDYFSGSFADESVKNGERHKIKLYSFAKNQDSDPDYHAMNFSIDSVQYYVYLWVGNQQNNFDMMMELCDEPRKQKTSEKATYFMEFLGTRPSLNRRPAPAKVAGEPDNLPF